LHATSFANFNIFIAKPHSAFNRPIIYLSNTHTTTSVTIIYYSLSEDVIWFKLPSVCHNAMSHYLILHAFSYQVITAYN